MFLTSLRTAATPRHRNWLPVWCCCAALILEFSAWVSRAEATCGDYLTLGSGHFAVPGAIGMAYVPIPAQAGTSLPGMPVRRPRACPSCSSRETPVTTAPLVVRLQHDLAWACLTPGDSVFRSPSRWAAPPRDALAAQDASFRILRPPRLLSLDGSARDQVA